MTISCTLGIEKGRDGYPDRNKIKTVLTPDSPNYIQSTGQAAPVAQAPVAQAPVAQPQQTVQSGVAPSWAR